MHSTSKTIANLTSDILALMNQNKLVGAAFLDFSKAFDTVDHDLLLKKLKNMSIKANSTLLA